MPTQFCVPGKRRDRKPKGSKPNREHSTIAQHTRVGKTLVPPAGRLPNLRFASWLNDRLPEVIWIALLHTQLGRKEALNACRMVVTKARTIENAVASMDLTLSGLTQLPANVRYDTLAALCNPDPARQALRPLLLFPDLPAREEWQQA